MNRRDLEAKYILEQLAGTLPGKWMWTTGDLRMPTYTRYTLKEYASYHFKMRYKVKTKR